MMNKKENKWYENRKKTVSMAIFLATVMMSTACGNTAVSNGEVQTQETGSTLAEEDTVETAVTTPAELADYVVEYSDRDADADWSDEEAVDIILTDAGISTDGNGVVIDGTTITITEEGTYVLSGSSTEANVVVNAPEGKIHIVLNGVSITSASQAPVNVVESKKVVVTLAEGTENEIIDNRSTDTTEENAAIYAKENLTFNGTGKLTVTSENNNGITSKDELIFMEGEYALTVGGHGITGKDYTAIKDGTFTITAGKDGIRATNTDDANLGFVRIENGTFTINAQNDGIQAETLAYIINGTFDITAGGGSVNGAAHTENGFGGGGFGGERPADMPEKPAGQTPGDMPEKPDGEAPADMPAKPDGEAPADMPEKPDGETPADMPTKPDGETPTDMPTKPDGEAPADMPEKPSGEAPTDMPEKAESDTMTESANTVDDTTEETSESSKGIKAGTLVYIENGILNMDTADDAVHSNGDVTIVDGTITIASGDDGIHAGSILTINNGDITMTQTYEGLEGAQIIINDGNIDLTASDDGINVAGGNDSSSGNDTFTENMDYILTVNGGTIHIDASGDGLDSNGSIVQNGGCITVDGPENGGNGALDYNTTYTMTGGTLFAAGSSGMMQSISDDSTVYCLSAIYSENLSEGDEVIISDENGNELLTYTIAKSGNSFVYADEKMTSDMNVTVSVNGEEKTVTLADINTKLSADGTVSTGAITDAMDGGHGKKDIKNKNEQ